MKKVTVKIKENIVGDKCQMKSLMGDVKKFCVPGTINLRIGIRQISFRINDSDEFNIKTLSAFENKSIQVIDSNI